MEKTDRIMEYLTRKYRPTALIVYGSYSDGSANENSDFDALLIADHPKTHDASVVEGTVLDVFVYPVETFQGEYDPEEFLQVYDGKILLDRDGTLERLKTRVNDYIGQLHVKSRGEIRQELEWCGKMLARTVRDDAEGYYRWHWLLVESLEIYCDVRAIRCFGPKKALRRMKKEDEESFRIYSGALKEMDRACLSEWIARLNSLPPTDDFEKGS